MASAQNHFEVENYENFNFTISLETNHVYIRMVNIITFQSYEKNIEMYDLESGNIRNLDSLFKFFKKVLHQIDNYEIQIQIYSEYVNIFLKKEIDDLYTIQTNVQIPKILSSSSSSHHESLIRMEEKHKREMISIRQEMELMVSQMKFLKSCLEMTQVCIGQSRYNSHSILRDYDRMIPFCVSEISICYSRGHNQETHLNYNFNSTTIYLHIIYFNNIRRLYNLKKIKYTRYYTSSNHTGNFNEFRNPNELPYLASAGINYTQTPNFNFGKLNNQVLEELEFNNNGFVEQVNLSTIENIPSLKKLTIELAPNLSNASEYIRLLPNLTHLTFKTCPKIQSEDSGRLRQYCDSKGIILMIQ